MTKLVALALVVASAASTPAAGFQVLTVGKVARFVNRGDAKKNGGTVTIGRDPALGTLHDPRCPTTSTLLVEAYLQSTYRDSPLVSGKSGMLTPLALDCAKWKTARRGFAYADAVGPVRSMRYTSNGLRIEVGGSGFTPMTR